MLSSRTRIDFATFSLGDFLVEEKMDGDGATVEFKSGLVAIARENQKAFDGLALFENCFFTSNPTVTFPVLFLSQAKFRQLTVDNGKYHEQN